ncbi:probable pectinesterase/pectinesterase inhibitor 46 [Actinidia eriantha]|uniref:probable pectinesterase/pectinesterase inhibitor 46 n=1 Tax=Actinidia eriantha TaxID=165200 RepID=UPI00258D9DEC|nr:probable pectinesterase/pectinesterase inhibitor 46 [Actinidia eriantha]
MASLGAYWKVDEAEQERLDAFRKTRKRVTIIALSSIVFVGVLVAAVVGGINSAKDGRNGGSDYQSVSTSVKAVCDGTLYPDSCYSSLNPLVHSSQDDQPVKLFKLSVQVAKDELSRASQFFSENGPLLPKGITDDKMSIAALKSCRELLGLALDHLESSLSTMGDLSLFEAMEDLKTWLSSAGTCQQTCMDGFDHNASLESLKISVSKYLQNSTEFTSNSLAIMNQFAKLAKSLKLRRLMSLPSAMDDMPHWLSPKDRRLLQSSILSTSKMKVDVIVAKDGSGKYKTINDALNAVPEKSKKRFVIYVKKGVYNENVRVEKSKWNVMMFGDGMEATLVSGSLNFVDGTPTFQTATFAVFGKGFIARDMGFCNTAGSIKHQAVALMSTSDQSVFYRCGIDAFQDSLYAHSNRQFYRECNIYGTVDFIFGNSAVVLQNCNILPKVPMPGQQNTITAQGKIDPNQNTGISIQNCTIWPSGNLSSVSTFLGRPWKNYSTTVYMGSMMGSFIDPKGWLPWTGDTAPDTIFYVEYKNFGPGSSTKNRVNWKGLRNITNKQATKFTVKSFINGDKWLPETGVKYKPGL